MLKKRIKKKKDHLDGPYPLHFTPHTSHLAYTHSLLFKENVIQNSFLPLHLFQPNFFFIPSPFLSYLFLLCFFFFLDSFGFVGLKYNTEIAFVVSSYGWCYDGLLLLYISKSGGIFFILVFFFCRQCVNICKRETMEFDIISKILNGMENT